MCDGEGRGEEGGEGESEGKNPKKRLGKNNHLLFEENLGDRHG